MSAAGAWPATCRGLRRGLAVVSLATLLAACGGGGGGGDDDDGDGLPSSDSLSQQCLAPRPAGTLDPFTDRPYGDRPGSLATEKAFLRSWIDETYLWYRDVRALPAATLEPAAYATPQDYFEVLKSPLTTPSGRPKDQFHFTYPTPEWVTLSQSGASLGYGFQVALVNPAPPAVTTRSATVVLVEPGSPAFTAGVRRGDKVQAIDGRDFSTSTETDILNAGLYPSVAGPHAFTFRRLDASTYAVTLTAQQVTMTPVRNARVLPAPNAGVGYLLFNDHVGSSEPLLVDAIETLRTAAVTDLVLDLRYNGGGYLDIAAQLAYMIAGPARTSTVVFERLEYNDRDPFGNGNTPFHTTTQGLPGGAPAGRPLPTLNLSRVFVLTSADTCSASESIVNGLRGVGVTVHLVGGTTCGKPYGFYPRDNCNTTYFAVQFRGVNAQGFGDYADGFAPTCAVADDVTHELGDPAEGQLAMALGYRQSGSCVPAAGLRPRALSAARVEPPATRPVLVRPPTRENRIYRAP